MGWFSYLGKYSMPHQPKIPYPEKITFKDKDVSDKQNDPHTNTTKYAKEIS